MSESDKASAGEFVLGLLNTEEYAALSSKAARQPAMSAEISAWEERLAPLARSIEPVMPAPALLDRVMSAIQVNEVGLAGTTTIRANQGTWVDLGHGVSTKILWENAALGRKSALIRMEPGSVYTSHSHGDIEECLVLSGDFSFGDFILHEGDFHVAAPGAEHPVSRSASGCMLMIVSDLAHRSV